MTMKFGSARGRLITTLNIWEMILLVFIKIYVHNHFTIVAGQIVSFPKGSLYGHMCSTYYTCFVNQSLMKFEMKINEISSG